MIVLLATVVVVCVGIVFVAVGRGGQIVEFIQDAPPGLPERRPIAGTDVALLRLPTGPWGYSYRHTDDALRRIAHALTERDTRIAILEQQVSEMRAGLPVAGGPAGSAGDDDQGSPWFDRAASFAGRRAPIAGRTGEAAAIEAPPAGEPAGPDDTEFDDAPRDDAGAAAEPDDDLPQDAAEPEDDAPGGDAFGEPWEAQKAWTPAVAWTANGSGQQRDEPEDAAGSDAADAAEPDEDWAFEGDDEDEAEPQAPAQPSASAFGSSKPAPWPGDRLVASSRPRTEPEDVAEENADPAEEGEDDSGETETGSEGAAEDAADVPEDTRDDEPDDETAGGRPRGEGR